MSEAPPPISRDDARLERLADLDLMAAEKTHAKLMAAEDTAELAECARAYQRAARSLRQTLALKAKLAHDRAVRTPASPQPPRIDMDALAIDIRLDEVQDAVARVISAAYQAEPEREAECWTRFDREMDDWILDELFAAGPLDDHVAEVCQTLGLPAGLAAAWRTLPVPERTPDPVTRDDPAAPPAEAPPPIADTG